MHFNIPCSRLAFYFGMINSPNGHVINNLKSFSRESTSQFLILSHVNEASASYSIAQKAWK